ncbi:hypothetical protein BUY10_00235 [Staphylococcus chromogenes]|nr:hypothetical protein BUY10_00235 [Staphylococcus chromogenes]PTG73419.1 hypothetical protein BU662_04570 [Staphylococcus chromogenes]
MNINLKGIIVEYEESQLSMPFFLPCTCLTSIVYSRSELYSPAEAIYLTIGPAGDFFLAFTRYIFALQLCRAFL